jgi:23S rRNA (cytosine1962-C5)-methyltransferase
MSYVRVTKRGADRIRNGHLWIYRADVLDADNATGGSVASVRDQQGNFVGQALFSDLSEITLRFLTQNDETINREWWRRRIRAAAARREDLKSQTDAYRLVYSEGDLLPSLIVDLYGDVLVLQTLAQGTDAIKSMLVELLVEEFGPRAIVERNDVAVRKLEGLESSAGTLFGDRSTRRAVCSCSAVRTKDGRVSRSTRESRGNARDRPWPGPRLLHLQRKLCAQSRNRVRERRWH